MNAMELHNNREAYMLWKADIEKNGKTPADMVELARNMGMPEYADQLEAFISKMEAPSEVPA